MCDTLYFQRALDEYNRIQITEWGRELKAGELPLAELSNILRRAQQLKDADKAEQLKLDRARENALGKMGD